jgi:hypothetical protein
MLDSTGVGEIFGEWSFISSGNAGASANIIAAEDETKILEFSHAEIERLRYAFLN